MKVNTVDTVIQNFRDYQNIFRRSSVELLVREILKLRNENEKLNLRLAANENDFLVKQVSEMLKEKQAHAQKLEVTLNNLYDACMLADQEGELSWRVNGELLDETAAILNYPEFPECWKDE